MMTELPHLDLEDFATSPTIGKLMDALAKAQGAMPAPLKNKKNPHFGSMYADHAAVVECSKPHLAANGLAIVQGNGFKDERVVITTLLGHSSGEWIRTRLSIRPDKPTAQGIGSTVTYGRRYGHCAILNMAPDDDDDGNGASPAPKKQDEPKPQNVAKPPAREQSFQPDNTAQLARVTALLNKAGIVDQAKISSITAALKGVPLSGVQSKLQELINGPAK
jgi:hypothetical protein